MYLLFFLFACHSASPLLVRSFLGALSDINDEDNDNNEVDEIDSVDNDNKNNKWNHITNAGLEPRQCLNLSLLINYFINRFATPFI